jgi:hypothetical protein
MTPQEFELYRRLLFLSVIEASRNVACTAERPEGASERAWNRWEAGTSPIPESVATNLLALVQQRQQSLDSIALRLQVGETVIVPLGSPPGNVVAYKLNQSIAAAALAMGARIEVGNG